MKLLLIGPSTRAMAESAARARYNFFTIDFFGDSDQKAVCENYSLREMGLEYALKNLVQASLTKDFTHVIYGSGFENHPDLVKEFEKKSIVLGNDSKTLKKVRDWRIFFRTLKKLGIRYPETRIVKADEVEDVKGMIVKPTSSGGGRYVSTSSKAALEGELLLQEFIEGKPISTSVLCSDSECHYVGATEQIIGDQSGTFRYCGNVSPADNIRELEEISLNIAEAFKLKGCNGIDFILSPEGPCVLEVNPRLTGAMEVIEKSYKLNLVDLHVKACLGEVEIEKQVPKGFYGRKIVYAQRDIRFNIRAPKFIKDVPHFNDKIQKGNPICTVLGFGKTLQQCYKDLVDKENKIYEDLRKSNM
jgi:hypothetical protein